MKIFIFLIRLISLVLLLTITCIITLIFSPLLPLKYWSYLVWLWARATLMCSGAKIEVITADATKAEYIQPNSMVIANHISWLDIPLLYTLRLISFVGRAEMQKWPVLNLLMKSVGTVFIDRSKKRELINLNQILSNKLINGAAIGLFPEGKTSDGTTVLPFKSSLLESAIIAKSTITPLVIKYYTKDGQVATEVTYEGEINFWQTIKNSLLLNGIYVKVILLAKINATEFATREELTRYLFEQINNTHAQIILKDDKCWNQT